MIRENETIAKIESQQALLDSAVADQSSQIQALGRGLDKANAGIAAAMALGGTMIVPDSNWSLSFNLSTYRGEQGYSGAVVGRVSRKVYVNAGMAGSTRRGSTGGRVGFAIGL